MFNRGWDSRVVYWYDMKNGFQREAGSGTKQQVEHLGFLGSCSINQLKRSSLTPLVVDTDKSGWCLFSWQIQDLILIISPWIPPRKLFTFSASGPVCGWKWVRINCCGLSHRMVFNLSEISINYQICFTFMLQTFSEIIYHGFITFVSIK